MHTAIPLKARYPNENNGWRCAIADAVGRTIQAGTSHMKKSCLGQGLILGR